ncbi:MAG: hypothetical protein JW895_04865 [Thermoleophilaceae bacterium]|nr:hypothetical protein [Thermoleophilaceae bacterium]
MPAARTVKEKKRCCKSNPRCKRCPVVMKRLAKQGHAERLGRRTYTVLAPKKAVKAARAR